jgi:hypothetical protein
MMLAFASMAYEFARMDDFTGDVATSHAPLTPFTLLFLSTFVTRPVSILEYFEG